MHRSGIIFIWIIALMALVAIRATARVFEARAQFVRQKVQLEDKMARNEKEIPDLQRKLRQTQRDLSHELLSWAPFWNDVNVEVRQDNSIVIDIGAQQGLQPSAGDGNASTQHVVHLFQPGQDGGSQYVGEFQVTSLEANRALLVPNWDLFEGETDSWNGTEKWRVRALVPSQHQIRFSGLEFRYGVERELLASKQEDLAKQQELLAAAEEGLAKRVAELEGPQGDVPDADQRPREDVVGLLTTLEELEEVRNAILARSDDLRRQLLSATENFERIQAENLRVVENLPQGDGMRAPGQAGGVEASTVSR